MKPGFKVKLPTMGILILAVILLCQTTDGADLVIRIPSDLSHQDGFYRLDYRPPIGFPPANTTFRPTDIRDQIEFSGGDPGTKYEFKLYYSNSTTKDFLTWRASITTAPDPPSNLSIDADANPGKVATLNWEPPSVGGYSGFRLKVKPRTDLTQSVRTVALNRNASPFLLRDLTPGATYEIELSTVYGKESAKYITTNFTTKPNTPGRFIVWFRNETTLLVLWQPPYPAGVYSDYKVSIDPSDATDSEIYVNKETEPPGPAQAAFNGLIPGRAYNISVQTVSENKISQPTIAQYRTVPWRPHNVTFDPAKIGPNQFEVSWSGPRELTEFDRYQVAIGIRRKTPQNIERNAPLSATFNENLRPGRTYQVVVKTVSGSVASWPATGNVTTQPLPVIDNIQRLTADNGDVSIMWEPNPDSEQDNYKITYHELESFNGEQQLGRSEFVSDPIFPLSNLLPGRNYSISVQAVSKGVESVERSIFQATKPASPIIEDVAPLPGGGLNISWKSDVTSRQEKYIVEFVRNDTGTNETIETATPRVRLQDLYPGAGYQIKVYARSHNLNSEPHISFTAVYPNAPRNLTIVEVRDNNVKLSWQKPRNSLFSGYTVRYRVWPKNPGDSTGSDLPWIVASEEVQGTTYTLEDLTFGEHFQIEVDTVSHHVHSGRPLTVVETIKPQTISEIESVLGAENVTLKWPVPEGRVDVYRLKWYPLSNSEDVRVRAIPGKDTSVDITNLHPGVDYMFEITTEAHNLRSAKKQVGIRTMPLILSDITLINQQEVTTALTLRYTQTPLRKSLFDTYRFQLSPTNQEPREKAAQNPERKVVFSDLVPGRLYNITMWTVSGGVPSRPLERQDRLYPDPIGNVNATRITDTEIFLEWQAPPGDYDGFDVAYLNFRNKLIQESTDTNSISIGRLRPFREYTFTIVTKSGGPQSIPRRSSSISARFKTEEAVPGSLANFKPYEVHPSEIKFRWELPPLKQNGKLEGFVIEYGQAPLGSEDGPSFQGDDPGPFRPDASQEFNSQDREGAITGLIPDRRYTFQIRARTRKGYGQWVRWTEKMPVWAPPLTSERVVAEEVSRSMTTVTIRFKRNFFSDKNGPVIAYAIIVAEDYLKPTDSKPILPKWQDVQQFSSWIPYQVSDPQTHLFTNATEAEVVVGTDNCNQVKNGNYCNGPLKPGTEYRFKIRAYTTPERFSETRWSKSIRTDPDNTAVLVGIIIPIILLILAVIVIFAIKRIRNKRENSATANASSCVKMRRVPGMREGAGEMRHGGDNISLPDSVVETSKPVKLKDFAEHYRIMSADSDFRFSEEYEELKHVGREKPCLAADMPVNRPKNRFTNILPYDHSRVKLQPTDDEEGSDFINANFVPGHNSPREFVVTQGPLHSTRDDFWRMCWETNSRAIVMLTRCVEKGREKCDRYWPYDTQPVYYGDIQVTIMNESLFPDWNVTEFRMMRGDAVRSIRHFHFTTWPDFGVPEPPQTLVRFVRAFRERVTPEQRPVVVHCSAGVGRSGTFIALDRILQTILRSDVVDIFGIVYEMRKERVWMVQTEQQYICIHQCLLAVLEGRENDPPMHEMHDNEGFEDDEGIAESGM